MSCFQLLGLPDRPVPSADAVKQAWRLAAKGRHPDQGGDPVEFARLLKAYEEAMEEALAPRQCAPCQGTGKTTVGAGWSAVKLVCLSCGGTGQELTT